MKLRTLLLTAALLGVLCVPAAAADAASGSCGEAVTWSYEAGTLTISGSGPMEDYNSITAPAPWYPLAPEITAVTIGEGVTRVGDYAFLRCMALESAALPESLTAIGQNAFSNCSALAAIDIPAGVTDIGDAAFWFCESLTEVDIPAGVTAIGLGTFNRCDALVSVELPAGLKVIDERAFNECYALADITLPDGLTFIGMDAFSYCRALPSVVIPDTVTRMDSWAFNHCEVMTSAVIGSGITNLDESVFRKCYLLTEVDIRGQVTALGPEAFAACPALERITLPASVESIADGAFSGCDALKTVTYGGTADEWAGVSIGADNEPLTAAAVSCTGTVHTRTAFDDVTNGAWYAPAVAWAVERGITNGTAPRTFSPDADCTRAQILTFLYRAAGSPAVELAAIEVEDCDPSDWYGTAVHWAAGNILFDGDYAYPAAACTRAMAVDFLYRLNGSPAADVSSLPFEDVPEALAPAVAWAVAQGITNGTDETHFSPDMTCTRGTIVTLLYRAAGSCLPAAAL